MTNFSSLLNVSPLSRRERASGFLEISVGFVVCPSRNPRRFMVFRVSSGSPPSKKILVSRLLGLMKISSSVDLALCLLLPRLMSSELVAERRDDLSGVTRVLLRLDAEFKG